MIESDGHDRPQQQQQHRKPHKGAQIHRRREGVVFGLFEPSRQQKQSRHQPKSLHRHGPSTLYHVSSHHLLCHRKRRHRRCHHARASASNHPAQTLLFRIRPDTTSLRASLVDTIPSSLCFLFVFPLLLLLFASSLPFASSLFISSLLLFSRNASDPVCLPLHGVFLLGETTEGGDEKDQGERRGGIARE